MTWAGRGGVKENRENPSHDHRTIGVSRNADRSNVNGEHKVQVDSKLLSGFPWPMNENPDNNLESTCSLSFEAVASVNIEGIVFWDVTLCSLPDRCQH
jgi:hypothetical protein